MLCQINGGSLTGAFGRRARTAAERLMDRGWVEFVASDAHNLLQRPFSLLEARQLVQNRWGGDEVRRLFDDNPGRAIAGEPVVHRESTPPRRRRSVLRQLLPNWR